MYSSVVILLVLTVGASMAAVMEDNPMNQVQNPISWGGFGMHMGSSVDVGETPNPCCTPVQWQGTISGSVAFQKHWFSRAELVQEMVYFSYDGTNQRIAMNGTVFNKGKPNYFGVIELFKEKKMYAIDGKGNCVSKDLSVGFQPMCIPANSTYGGRTTMGMRNESLQADMWMMENGGYYIASSVTPKQCIPLGEAAWGKGEGWHGVPLFSAFGFTDITPGIKSATIFIPPKDCPPGVSEIGAGLMQYMQYKVSGQ